MEKEDLNFLETYWIKINEIKNRIKQLPFIEPIGTEISKTLRIVSYKYLDDWNIKKMFGTSDNLKALTDKLVYMVEMNRSNDIPIMLKSIANNRIKKLYIHYDKIKKTKDFVGRGHFRWNFRAYKLTDTEILHLKKFFNL